MTTKTVTTLPLDTVVVNTVAPIDTSEIKPEGICCFCIPLKPGAITIVILGAVGCIAYSMQSFIIDFFLIGVMLVFYACINAAGAYFIYTGNQPWSFIYACTYLAIQAISLAIMIAFPYTICEEAVIDGVRITPEKCRESSISAFANAGMGSILTFYFAYVLFDYSAKLRRAINQAEDRTSQA